MNGTFLHDKLGAWIGKDPNDQLNYTLDWNVAGDSWLGAATIAGAPAWTLEAGLINGGSSNTTTTSTVKLTGGTVGGGTQTVHLEDGTVAPAYLVSCRVTTSLGEVADKSFRVVVGEN